MKATIRCDGTDGIRSYKPGDEYVGDSEWLRKKLVNGLAEPADEEANKVVSNPGQIERYGSATLVKVARDLGIAEDKIPAASKFPAKAQAKGKGK